METWLYEHQEELSRDKIKDKVREIAGVEDFDAQYPKLLPEVRKDVQLGQKLEVTGTPTFFLNGIKMPTVRVSHLDAAIAYELKKAGVPVAGPA
jgi:protein-disulfide isomerase